MNDPNALQKNVNIFGKFFDDFFWTVNIKYRVLQFGVK